MAWSSPESNMNRRTLLAVAMVAAALHAAACGGDDEPCDAVANTGCESGLTCEVVSGTEETVCVAPVVIRGRVFDIGTNAGIADARVVAVDVNGAPVTGVTVSAADGSYELPVPSARTAEGAIIAQDVTLRVDAQGYVPFPAGIRPALPISTGTAVEMTGALVIQSTLTDVGLLVPTSAPGTSSIAGTAAIPESRAGILVVAQNAAGVGFSAIADIDGDYKIFNVPAGDWTVTAYAQGANHVPATVTLGSDEDRTGVDLALDAARPASTVTGSVQIVSATVCQSGSPTSVILAVEATFDDAIVRGQTPPGLRVGDVTSAWSIAGVPDGRYVVLAAFENDCWVRDPSDIAGTDIQRIAVPATLAAGEFKVTSGIVTGAPGRDGPETVAAAPTFTWTAYPAANDGYEIDVFDALGANVWNATVPGGTTSVAYGASGTAAPLTAGMYYQWRLRASGGSGLLATSEDLRGVFLYQP